MRLRWSNGVNFAVEFDPDHKSIQDALIEYRGHRPCGRAELHVQVTPERWTDPAPEGYGYVHVIHIPGREPDPSPDRIPVRGTDRVLLIGPHCWHEQAVLAACQRAISYWHEVTGLLPYLVASRVSFDPQQGQKGAG